MNFNLAPYHLLARNNHNWRILQLSDGRVQLDFGPFAMAVTWPDFRLLHSLAEAALAAPARPGRLLMLEMRRVFGSIRLVYADTLLRFRQVELLTFVDLCRKAVTALDSVPALPPSDNSLN
ncbi:MAG: hypothetical protein MI924_14395 [Chloroflexales bacterium]|nr:hypothetical protein [Chloroflexales bacterium]